MAVPEHLLGFWRAFDERAADVRPTWWGAVVTDRRFPAVHDVNYARVETADRTLAPAEIEAVLLPALAAAGAATVHVVGFRPQAQAGLFAELEARGHRLAWDLVMDLDGTPRTLPGIAVEELDPSPELREARGAGLALFGIDDPETREQLLALEDTRDALGLKRWFIVRDGDGIASTAALCVLDDVGLIDDVATVERARGRGYASAAAAAAGRAALEAGARHVTLLADPGAPAVIAMYERLGFRPSGHLPSTRGPVPSSAEPGSARS